MIFSIAAAAVSLATLSADVTYQHDDGTGGNAGPVGAGTPGMFVWGNVFDANTEGGGASEITAILVAVGRLPAGQTITALLFDDPNDDGNPDDCVLLTSVEFTPVATASNTFTQIDISPTLVSGKFFVACTTHVDGTTATSAARTDPQSGQQYGANTFFYWGTNMNPLALTGWTSRVQYTGATAAMIRAIGRIPAPACTADLGAAGGLPGHDGVLNNNDFIAFISLFFNHDPQADLGTAGGLPGQDGAFDNNDFIAFISHFFAGC
ncbi:MAG: GC-type dockerin domain-anchored protein [Phycisphaerales bacterium]